MPYTKTNWTDEVPASTPVKYKISQVSDGDIATDATIELVTSVTPGTPVNASNLNKQEQAISDAYDFAFQRTVQLPIVDIGMSVASGDYAYFYIPDILDGMTLVRAQAFVDVAGTTNPTTIQVRNLTKYASNDALSTAISIASGGTVGTVGVINAAYDDVSTNDKIKVYVTGVSATKPTGLTVILEYLP